MGQQNPGQIQQQQQKQNMKLIQLPEIDVSPLQTLQGEERNNFVGNNIYGHIFAVLG
jgi:TolB-like protein